MTTIAALIIPVLWSMSVLGCTRSEEKRPSTEECVGLLIQRAECGAGTIPPRCQQVAEPSLPGHFEPLGWRGQNHLRGVRKIFWFTDHWSPTRPITRLVVLTETCSIAIVDSPAELRVHIPNPHELDDVGLRDLAGFLWAASELDRLPYGAVPSTIGEWSELVRYPELAVLSCGSSRDVCRALIEAGVAETEVAGGLERRNRSAELHFLGVYGDLHNSVRRVTVHVSDEGSVMIDVSPIGFRVDAGVVLRESAAFPEH